MKHRVGFIGTGEIARIHADSIRRLGLPWEISGSYDLNSSLCDEFCGIYGGVSCKSAEDLLGSSLIDTVYICTRHDSHAAYGEAACEAGKNVFMEKPVAMNARDAKKLKNTWDQKPVPFAIGYNMRVTPAMLELKKRLKEYRAAPESFRASMTGTRFMQGWAGDPGCGGGVLVCQGSHMFDLITDLFESRISEICTEVQWLGQPQELEPNGATLLLRLENGICGTLLLHDRGSNSYHVAPGGGMVNITVYSKQGTFDADAYGDIRYGTGDGLITQSPAGTSDLNFRWGYFNEAKLFAQLLEGDATPLCTVKQAVDTAAVVDAARESAGKRGWVPVKTQKLCVGTEGKYDGTGKVQVPEGN